MFVGRHIWHLNVCILLAFSTCFLYLNENVLPCGLIRGDTDLTFKCIHFSGFLYLLSVPKWKRFALWMYRFQHLSLQQSRQSICQSIKAFNRIYCTHLYLFNVQLFESVKYVYSGSLQHYWPENAHAMWLSISTIFSMLVGSISGLVILFSTARMTPSPVWMPMAVLPSLMASMAYSTWNNLPSGEKVFGPRSYSDLLRNILIVGLSETVRNVKLHSKL